MIERILKAIGIVGMIVICGERRPLGEERPWSRNSQMV